jgi:secreted trypsin-like serine protease
MHRRAGRRVAGIVLIGALIGAFGFARVAGAQTTGDPASTTTTSAAPSSTAPSSTTTPAQPSTDGKRASGVDAQKQHPASDVSGGGDVNASVVGGVPVSTASFPWIAAILHEPGTGSAFDDQFCAGALIDPYYVMTAAHCVHNLVATPNQVSVALGHDDLDTVAPGQRLSVVQIIEDPQYSPTTWDHDVSLLKLTTPALGIPTAAYAIDDTNEAIGTVGGFMGWGDTGFGDTTLHGGATYVQTTPSDATCGAWGAPFYTNSSMMCIGQSLSGGTPATCQFDDGDPFVVGSPGGYRVVGLNMYGPDPCGQGRPDVYSRVSASASFITDTLDAPSGVGTYHPVPPVRVLDTRTGTGGNAPGALGPNGVINPQLTGMGTGGVPVAQGADAVVLNLVSVGSTSGGWLTAYPTGGAPPVAANLNFGPGENVSNLVTVQLGQGGKVSIANSDGSPSAGYLNVVADLVGWYSNDTTGDFLQVASTPARAIDTRTATGFSCPCTVGKVSNFAPKQITLCQPGSPVPNDLTALVVNATEISYTVPTQTPGVFKGFPGWLTMWGTGPAPVAANLNFDGTHITGGLSIVKTSGCSFLVGNSPGGDPNMHPPIDVILDVVGWYDSSGAQFHPMPPNRILDTRTGTPSNPGTGVIAGGATRDVNARGGATGVPTSATAVIVNTTAVGPAASGWLTAYPQDPVPAIASINFSPGQVVANLVGVGFAGSGSTVRLGNTTYPGPVTIPQGPVDVVMDVSGWFE